MDVYTSLPCVLQEMILSYYTLPELIAAEVTLTDARLIEVVRNTLGEAFINADFSALEILLCDQTKWDPDGITALLILERLPPVNLPPDIIYTYFSTQSYKFKEVVYKPLLWVIQSDDVMDPVQPYMDLCIAESSVAAINSGLPLIYNVIGSDMFCYLIDEEVLSYNPHFLLDHISEFLITPELAYNAFKSLDRNMAEMFVRQLVTPSNVDLIDAYPACTDIECVKSLGDVLRQDAPELYVIYKPFEISYIERFKI